MNALEAMEVRVMKERREMDGLVFMGERDFMHFAGAWQCSGSDLGGVF
jgi:hypothetical protein